MSGAGVHLEQGGEYAWKMTGVRVVWLHVGIDMCMVAVEGSDIRERYTGVDALMFALAAGYKLAQQPR